MSTPEFRVRRFATRVALQEALAERLKNELEYPGDRVAVMLSGGSTPLPAFHALGAQRLAPSKGLSILYSDDRHVPADSDGSNFFQSRPLLQGLALRDEQVLRVRTELPLALAADDYQQQLAVLLRSAPVLRFGMIGLGADGHTASLFSAQDLQRAQGRLAIAVHRPDGRDAVSVTPTVLEKFESLLIVIAGADKGPVANRLLAHDGEVIAMRAVAARTAVDVWGDAEALTG